MNFEVNDTIYTDEDIHIKDGHLAFKAYTPYTVYEIQRLNEEETEHILIDDVDVIHPLVDLQHLFCYMQ